MRKEILENLSSTDVKIIESVLHAKQGENMIAGIVEIYESLWKMTYRVSKDESFRNLEDKGMAHKIALINLQDDLFPKGAYSIIEVKSLDLGGYPWINLFPELLIYRNLRTLHLWENNLREIPEDIFKISTIEQLYVCDRILRLSGSISKLENLKILNLEGNLISELPDEIGTLNKLEFLNLSYNNITEIPLSILSLKVLKKIDIRSNQITRKDSVLKKLDDNGVEVLI